MCAYGRSVEVPEYNSFLEIPHLGINSVEVHMGPRWKGKGSERKALAEPMSKVVSELQSCLTNSNAKGLLSGPSVLLELCSEHVELFNRACFGRQIITSQKEKQWLQLGLDEAFYLCHSLNCLTIVGSDGCIYNDLELWHYMTSRLDVFPYLYKAYYHLRMKNWVVRSGSQYGVDYVAYRHHPALVHSDYAVLVLSDVNGRLKVWSDLHCTIRVCGSVAKTLLLLYVQKKEADYIDSSPTCLGNYSIVERIVSRWNPERNREEKGNGKGDREAERNGKGDREAERNEKADERAETED